MKKFDKKQKVAKLLATTIFGVGFVTPMMFSNITEANYGDATVTAQAFKESDIKNAYAYDAKGYVYITKSNGKLMPFRVVGNTLENGVQKVTIWAYAEMATSQMGHKGPMVDPIKRKYGPHDLNTFYNSDSCYIRNAINSNYYTLNLAGDANKIAGTDETLESRIIPYSRGARKADWSTGYNYYRYGSAGSVWFGAYEWAYNNVSVWLPGFIELNSAAWGNLANPENRKNGVAGARINQFTLMDHPAGERNEYYSAFQWVGAFEYNSGTHGWVIRYDGLIEDKQIDDYWHGIRPAMQIENQKAIAFTSKSATLTAGNFTADPTSGTDNNYSLDFYGYYGDAVPTMSTAVKLDSAGRTITLSGNGGKGVLLAKDFYMDSATTFGQYNANNQANTNNVSGKISYMATTNSDGSVKVDGVANGTYSLKLFSYNGTGNYVSELSTGAINNLNWDGGAFTITIGQNTNKGIAFELLNGGTVNLLSSASNALTFTGSGSTAGFIYLNAQTFSGSINKNIILGIWGGNGGSIAGNITGSGGIAIGNTVNADADCLQAGDIEVIQDANLILTKGALTCIVKGDGKVSIDGIVSANASNFTQNGDLTVSSGGTLLLTGGTLSKAVDGAGGVSMDGTVSANVNKFTQTGALMVANSGVLTLTGGTLSKAVTNNGTVTFTDGTLGAAVNGGTLNISTDMTTNADYILGNTNTVASGKTLSLNAGTLSKAVTNNGTVTFTDGILGAAVNGGTLNINVNMTTNADYILGNTNTVASGKTLTLNAGTLSKAVGGAGGVSIDGTVSANADNFTQTGALTVNANKSLSLTGGTLSKAVDGAGGVSIDGAVSANADNFTQTGGLTVNANKSLILTGGTLSKAVGGAGGVSIEGAVSANADNFTQNGGLTVNTDKTLTLTAGTLSKAVTNKGTVNFAGGAGGTITAKQAIAGGTVNVQSGMLKYEALSPIGDKLVIDSGAKLDPKAEVLAQDTTNNGELYLSGGELKVDVKGDSGTTYLKAEPAASAGATVMVKSDREIKGTLNGSAGAIDMRDKEFHTFKIGKLTGETNLSIDVALDTFTADKLTVAAAEAGSKINITNINVAKDINLTPGSYPYPGDSSWNNKITYVDGAGKDSVTYSISGNKIGTVTNEYVYEFTQGTENGKLNVSVLMAATEAFKKFVEGTMGASVTSFGLSNDYQIDGGALTLVQAGALSEITTYLNGYKLSTKKTDATSTTVEVGTGKTFNLNGGNGGTVADDVHFNVTAGTLNVQGDTTLNGTITAGSGTVNFRGTTTVNNTLGGTGTYANRGKMIVADAGKLQMTNGITSSDVIELGGGTLGAKIAGGDIKLTGNVVSTADRIAGAVDTNGKELDLTAGTLAGKVGGTGTLKVSGTVSSDVGYILADNNIVDGGVLGLTGEGELAKKVTGTGTVQINGQIKSDVDLLNGVANLEVASDKMLTLIGTDKVLTNTVGGAGNVTIGGTINAKADLFKQGGKLNVEGVLTLTGNTLGKTVEGTGKVEIKGDVSAAANLFANSGIFEVASGTLTLTGNTLSKKVVGAGNVTVGGNVSAAADLFAHNGTLAVAEAGTLSLTANTLGKDVAGTGKVAIAGNVTTNADKFASTLAEVRVENGKTLNLVGTGVLSKCITVKDGGTLHFAENSQTSIDDGFELENLGKLVLDKKSCLEFNEEGMEYLKGILDTPDTDDYNDNPILRVNANTTIGGTNESEYFKFVPKKYISAYPGSFDEKSIDEYNALPDDKKALYAGVANVNIEIGEGKIFTMTGIVHDKYGIGSLSFGKDSILNMEDGQANVVLINGDLSAGENGTFIMDAVSDDEFDNFVITGNATGTLSVKINVKNELMSEEVTGLPAINDRTKQYSYLSSIDVKGENNMTLGKYIYNLNKYVYVLQQVTAVWDADAQKLIVKDAAGEVVSYDAISDTGNLIVNTTEILGYDDPTYMAVVEEAKANPGTEIKAKMFSKGMGCDLKEIIGNSAITDANGKVIYNAGNVDTFAFDDDNHYNFVNIVKVKQEDGSYAVLLNQSAGNEDTVNYYGGDWGELKNTDGQDHRELRINGLSTSGDGNNLYGGQKEGITVKAMDVLTLSNIGYINDFKDGKFATNNGRVVISNDKINHYMMIGNSIKGEGVLELNNGFIYVSDAAVDMDWKFKYTETQTENTMGSFTSGGFYEIDWDNMDSTVIEKPVIQQKGLTVGENAVLAISADQLLIGTEGINNQGYLSLLGGTLQKTKIENEGVISVGGDAYIDSDIKGTGTFSVADGSLIYTGSTIENNVKIYPGAVMDPAADVFEGERVVDQGVLVIEGGTLGKNAPVSLSIEKAEGEEVGGVLKINSSMTIAAGSKIVQNSGTSVVINNDVTSAKYISGLTKSEFMAKGADNAVIKGVDSADMLEVKEGSSLVFADVPKDDEYFAIVAGDAVDQSKLWENVIALGVVPEIVSIKGSTNIYGIRMLHLLTAAEENLCGLAAVQQGAISVTKDMMDSVADNLGFISRPSLASQKAVVRNVAVKAQEKAKVDTVAPGQAKNVMPAMATADKYEKKIWASYVRNKATTEGIKLSGANGDNNAQYNGAIVGVDFYSSKKAITGMAISYVQGDINSSSMNAVTNNRSKYYGVALYDRVTNGNTAWIYDVGYSQGRNEINQYEGWIKRSSDADARTHSYTAGVRLENQVDLGKSKLVPFASFRYIRNTSADFRNSVKTEYATEKQNLYIPKLGIAWTGDFIMPKSPWTWRPSVEAGYVWNLGDRSAESRLSTFTGGIANIEYDTADRGSYYAKFGMDFMSKNFVAGINYRYMKGDAVRNNRWNINVEWSF